MNLRDVVLLRLVLNLVKHLSLKNVIDHLSNIIQWNCLQSEFYPAFKDNDFYSLGLYPMNFIKSFL